MANECRDAFSKLVTYTTEMTLIIQELMHLNVILYQYIHFFVLSEVLGRWWWCTKYIRALVKSKK